MAKHVIKYEYDNGIKLSQPTVWCGAKVNRSYNWIFQDAQHVALSAGGSVQPCKKCVKAIITQLQAEL